MKESVIMGKRQKETLSPNNYFGGKGGVMGKRGTIEIKTFPQQVMFLSHPRLHHVKLRFSLAEMWLLSDGDWLRPAGTGSDSTVPTVPPLRKNQRVLIYIYRVLYTVSMSQHINPLPQLRYLMFYFADVLMNKVKHLISFFCCLLYQSFNIFNKYWKIFSWFQGNQEKILQD